MTEKTGLMPKINLLRDKKVLGKSWGQTYNKYFGNKKNMLAFVKKIFPHIPKKKELKILYACSGPGFLGEDLVSALEKKRIKATLLLVDVSKKHLEQNKNPKTRKLCSDLLKARIREKFDVIIMRSSLDYFWTEKSQVRILKKLKRWLNAGGVFFNQAASMPTLVQRNLADKIYSSNNKIGKRHFQCDSDIFKIYKKSGFEKIRKIGTAPELKISEKEHAERYSISKEDVKRIQKISAKIPAKKRPNIKATETGYSMTFIYPIYSAKINEET